MIFTDMLVGQEEQLAVGSACVSVCPGFSALTLFVLAAISSTSNLK